MNGNFLFPARVRLDMVRLTHTHVDWNNTAMEPKSKGFYSPTEAAILRGEIAGMAVFGAVSFHPSMEMAHLRRR